MEEIYYAPKEVAEQLKLRVQTVYAYIRQGSLPAVRLGNRCRIAQSDLEVFLERHKGEPSSTSGSRPSDVVAEAPTQVERNEALSRLLAEWMADKSGYDESVWPIVEKLLEEHPVAI
jgi:excisionase family DNA binding protein